MITSDTSHILCNLHCYTSTEPGNVCRYQACYEASKNFCSFGSACLWRCSWEKWGCLLTKALFIH